MYAARGYTIVNALRGMFAFAICSISAPRLRELGRTRPTAVIAPRLRGVLGARAAMTVLHLLGRPAP